MKTDNRINAFHQLGIKLNSLSEEALEELHWKAQNNNAWFTRDNINDAIKGIIKFLNKQNLSDWVSNYSIPNNAKTVGTVMAGNIPFVGFHDLLCVLISGHRLMIKLSSQDTILMTFIIESLKEINYEFNDLIEIVDQLKGMDAIIATGSNNSARYFEYYFSKYPHIIRKNRSSCGIISGNESISDLKNLGKDIFQYYGLGCRNVSKLYVPKGYNFKDFFESIEEYSFVKDHHKYNNNYDYNKSIYLVNSEKHFDNGFLLVKPDSLIVSPISVIFYEEYESESQLKSVLENNIDKIQCLVSKDAWWPSSFNFGEAQSPDIQDYADHIDTMKFLCNLR